MAVQTQNGSCRVRCQIYKDTPALIQAVFYVGDPFWVRENQRPKNLKNNFFPR